VTGQAYATGRDLDAHARQSLGASDRAIYDMVRRAISERRIEGETLVDVGCGNGNLWPFVSNRFARYAGVDAIRYEGFPSDREFIRCDLDRAKAALPDECADVVVSIETIEHLENPRAFMRELVRLAKPGAWVLITTPNQLSLLSLMTLALKQRFSAFQDAHYPAHITALLEIDVKRIASECGLVEVEVAYSHRGRVVLTPWHYPYGLAKFFPRLLSDNLLLIGRKPGGTS
jgi:2-polyprenyl-3-methyl-5-hydroxy-6-metoxy-1,4-benzoquinol methylase